MKSKSTFYFLKSPWILVAVSIRIFFRKLRPKTALDTGIAGLLPLWKKRDTRRSILYGKINCSDTSAIQRECNALYHNFQAWSYPKQEIYEKYPKNTFHRFLAWAADRKDILGNRRPVLQLHLKATDILRHEMHILGKLPTTLVYIGQYYQQLIQIHRGCN